MRKICEPEIPAQLAAITMTLLYLSVGARYGREEEYIRHGDTPLLGSFAINRQPADVQDTGYVSCILLQERESGEGGVLHADVGYVGHRDDPVFMPSRRIPWICP